MVLLIIMATSMPAHPETTFNMFLLAMAIGLVSMISALLYIADSISSK